MAIMDEKTIEPTQVSSQNSDHSPDVMDGHAPIDGKPWMYKSPRLGPLSIPAYASTKFSIYFVGVVCFLCPGMFNAVNGLGAAGQVNPTVANDANTALYSVFCVVGFCCGSICNRIGLRLTLGIGGFGYFLYIASLLSYNHNGNQGFVIFAGALLGLCAGMLWTAQGAIMMSYPLEHEKGRFIAQFWGIFNLGGVVGAAIPLGLNIHTTTTAPVSDGTYIGFLILMAIGFIIACFLCNPAYVRKSDGSAVIMMKNPTWKSEIMGLLETLKTDYYIVLLFPMFLASNWFYTYHFNDVNLPVFNVRTRSLNNMLYWAMQIVGAGVVGYLLDAGKMRRTVRARFVLVGLMALTMVTWGGGYAFQKTYTRAGTLGNKEHVGMDFTDGTKYAGPVVMYMFYGFFDAAWQVTAYWLMGCLSNNSRKLACFAGFYKGIQSAGGAIAPAIDNTKPAFMTEFATNWGLLAGSLVIAAPVILYYVKDTVTLEEDLKFTDETIGDIKGHAEYTA